MERPIILKAHEVRGILDGRQSQLRRIIKKQPYGDANFFHIEYGNQKFGGPQAYLLDVLARYGCPFGQVGDRLWGRETCIPFEKDHVTYRADYELNPKGDKAHGVYWTPSTQMPRWASRILLEIVSVRVERLQDITKADAIAEGATCKKSVMGFNNNNDGWCMEWPTIEPAEGWGHVSLGGPIEAFANLINRLHGGSNWNLWYNNASKYPMPLWEQNPWVWVVESKRVEAA